jgi:hypothetical protein
VDRPRVVVTARQISRALWREDPGQLAGVLGALAQALDESDQTKGMSRRMSHDDVPFGSRLRLLTLAEELQNVSEACRRVGVGRQTYRSSGSWPQPDPSRPWPRTHVRRAGPGEVGRDPDPRDGVRCVLCRVAPNTKASAWR